MIISEPAPAVGLLLDPPGELHLQPVEGHHIPGRVREVQALRTQDRGEGITCMAD